MARRALGCGIFGQRQRLVENFVCLVTAVGQQWADQVDDIILDRTGLRMMFEFQEFLSPVLFAVFARQGEPVENLLPAGRDREGIGLERVTDGCKLFLFRLRERGDLCGVLGEEIVGGGGFFPGGGGQQIAAEGWRLGSNKLENFGLFLSAQFAELLCNRPEGGAAQVGCERVDVEFFKRAEKRGAADQGDPLVERRLTAELVEEVFVGRIEGVTAATEGIFGSGFGEPLEIFFVKC